MFYCEYCAKRYEYPTHSHIPRSRGRCELCKESSICYDVPCSGLPKPRKEKVSLVKIGDKIHAIQIASKASEDKSRRTTMAKLPETIKLKLHLEVDRKLYDRIVAEAKELKLEGTIENKLEECCDLWFDNWVKMFEMKDASDADVPKLVGLDGKPLIPKGEVSEA